MLRAVAMILVFWPVSVFATCSDNDLNQVTDGIAFCMNQDCNVSGHQNECNSKPKFRLCTPNSIHDAFGDCHQGNDEEVSRMDQCSRERPDDFIKRALPVVGCAAPAPPIVKPPPPIIKNIDFNVKMKPASDDKYAVIADFMLSGTGEYRSITIAYRRNGKKIDRLWTYAVNFDNDNDGQLHIKITTYDTSVKDVSRYNYEVAGTVSVLGTP